VSLGASTLGDTLTRTGPIHRQHHFQHNTRLPGGCGTHMQQ
jgi:hypothetical protein